MKPEEMIISPRARAAISGYHFGRPHSRSVLRLESGTIHFREGKRKRP
jgi:hypothetical protein